MRPYYESIPAVSIFLLMLTGVLSIVPHGRKAAYRMTLLSLSVVFAASVLLTIGVAGGESFS